MHQIQPLTELGWNASRTAEFAPYEDRNLRPGRVAAEHRGAYIVLTPDSEVWAEISGALRHGASERQDLPAVGDWVALDDREAGHATIRAVLARRSKFSRKVAGFEIQEQVLAANIDAVFVMTALDADLNLRRLERYLTTAWSSGALPVIVLSKADLCDDVGAAVASVGSVAAGAPIHVVSAATEEGIDGLDQYFAKHRTVAVLGSSGVGKSTLVNLLAGQETQRVKEIRWDGRGRHTTTHRELIRLPNGGFVIDTPGLRELQLWDVEEGLADAFEDIASLSHECRFRDCRHDREPGCAVRRAVEEGTLVRERLQSYNKLQRELRHLESKLDRKAAAERKRGHKEITKHVRLTARSKR